MEFKNRAYNTNNLKRFLFPAEILAIQKLILKEIAKHPIFYRGARSLQLSVKEQKYLSMKKSLLLQLVKLKLSNLFSNPYFSICWNTIISRLDQPSGIKNRVIFDTFPETVLNLGTDRHKQLYEDSCKGRILGSFCMTEVGHGSNTRLLQTTATYDKCTKQFILNTPSITGAKCWVANLGKMATHAIVYAQLITPDNKNHGVHSFAVPIRDSQTFLPYPGVLVADIGEKIGLQGIDNGFLMFNNYRIPKMNLLNKFGDVTDDGIYVSNTSISPQVVLSKTLTNERLGVIAESSAALSSALGTAVKCVSYTKQGNSKNTVYRLLPYLSYAYTNLIFLNNLLKRKNCLNTNTGSLVIRELDNLVSTGKAYFSLMAREGIKECIEACGPLGHLSVLGIEEVRSNNDASLTYNGDNNLLIHQTSNWLLQFWPPSIINNNKTSNLKSLDFLCNASDILQMQFQEMSSENFYKPLNLHQYYKWLVCYLLKKSYEKCNHLEQAFVKQFWIKKNSQIFYLGSLSTAYFESFVLQQTWLMIEASTDFTVKEILTKVLSLYGVWCLQKYVSYFYEGQFANNDSFAKLIEDSIFLLSDDIKEDFVPLVNAIGLEDNFVKSMFGIDGSVGSKLFSSIIQNWESFSNATWLKTRVSKL